jgi:hypothetical protein
MSMLKKSQYPGAACKGAHFTPAAVGVFLVQQLIDFLILICYNINTVREGKTKGQKKN